MPRESDQTPNSDEHVERFSDAARLAIGSLAPPLIALALDMTIFRMVSVWLLFQPAVLISAWIGGLKSAILASIASAVFVWCYVLVRLRLFDPGDSRQWITTAAFIASGIAVGALVERMRNARETAQRERDRATAANVKLQHAMDGVVRGRRILQSVIDNSPGVIVIKDLEGRLLLFNRSVEEAFGLAHADLVGKTVHDLFPPDVAERRWATEREVLENRKCISVEETVVLKGDARVYLASAFPLTDQDDELLGVCWIETDITERKRAEDQLRRSAADLAEAQRVGGIGSWYWDLEQDTVIWSDEMYRIHGCTRGDFVPSALQMSKLFAFESSLSLTAALQAVRAAGKPYEIELQTVESNGPVRWIVDRGEAIRNAEGAITGVRGISQDITRLKELQRLREEWISVIAHDLREPIGAIKMASQLLPELHHGRMDEREEIINQRVGKAASTLERMVGDLLDVSRLETSRLELKRSWIEPGKLARETIDGLTHLTGGNRVVVREEKAPERVFADAGRLRQVLTNLVSNAVKYGRKGGEIVVFVKGRDQELEVVVWNHGSGIAERDLGQLFTRFGRLDDARRSGVQGLGLGLYLAKGLVEAHGGRIWCESSPSRATSFHFTIPMEKASRVAA